jgi:hypothetical protein
MQHEIILRITLQLPPPGVDFALQKGRGSAFEAVQRQKATAGNLYFECTAVIKNRLDGTVDWSGPFIQGPAGGRFIYIGIGTFAGNPSAPWSRRLKIPLTGIIAEEEYAIPGMILQTTVPGTARDGSPACATVKPLDGWKWTEGSKKSR